jgi:hypothetical protein
LVWPHRVSNPRFTPLEVSTPTITLPMQFQIWYRCYLDGPRKYVGRGRRGRMVTGFTTTCAISAYHHLSCEFEPSLWGGVLDTLGDKVYRWLATGRWFFPGTSVSSTNKTDRHDIAEILLKVVFTINQTIHNYVIFVPFTNLAFSSQKSYDRIVALQECSTKLCFIYRLTIQDGHYHRTL